ncbi:uncharacterized protein VTP21DRAFT_4741 [Calcarisporiella thermophila]|uniref:uncharacterized protein n=1 Tax=Calcarisporiella thermophila TaxID=911321 RepID=UPI003743C37B
MGNSYATHHSLAKKKGAQQGIDLFFPAQLNFFFFVFLNAYFNDKEKFKRRLKDHNKSDLMGYINLLQNRIDSYNNK